MIGDHLQPARDDEALRLIRTDLDATLFVEAGAGTGKTRALVDRYIGLIAEGRRVNELVAITFTDKAAAELADRVRADLERRLSSEDEHAQLLEQALAGFDRAQISTIHAFAMNALRSFAAESGIDPSFRVQDEVAAERRFLERWRSYLEDAGDRTDVVEAVNHALALGLTTRDLQTLAHELWSHGELAERLIASPLEAEAADLPDLAVLRQLLLALKHEDVPSGDRLRTHVGKLLAVLDRLLAAHGEDRLALLADLVPALKPESRGQQGNWGGRDAIARARADAGEVCTTLHDTLRSQRSEALARLLPVCLSFVAAEGTRRLREGELLFDDLILRLRDLLRDDADACARLRARFATLLIDEFQDTDPLQVDLAFSFAGHPATGAVEAGRLFLVGDPKQSIYRFRRADMAIYAAARESVLADGGRDLELSRNRRSRPAVLRFVNSVFAALIGQGDEPSLQPPYLPIFPLREEDCLGPGTATIGDESDEPARDLRRREAQQIAACCWLALQEGWEVFDRDAPAARKAKYRDIAILIPTRTILQPLESALLAAAIPYRIEGGSLVYATQEVRDLINCLSAIDDPGDDVAVVAALRSPAFGCSDVELARHRLGGGSFNYLAPDLPILPIPPGTSSARVTEALLSLRAFHFSRRDGPIARLTERFIAGSRLVEAATYDRGSRDGFRRARFVIEQARAFEAEQPETLRSFIEWLERQAGEAILDHEGTGLDDDEDAVRVLTVHAAKGLEFPIVFLAGLGVAPINRTAVLAEDRATGDVAISIGAASRGTTFQLGPVEAVKTQEKRHELAERDRLLYVAATRARDHLVISLFRPNTRDTAAQRLVGAGAVEAAEIRLSELRAIEDQRQEPFTGLVVTENDLSEEEFLDQRAQLVQATRHSPVTSATALKGSPAGQEGDEPGREEEREDDSEPWSRGRAGTHRGRAVHAALQVLPWDADDATIEALARAQAVAEAIPGEADRVATLLRRALTTNAAARARAAQRAQREVPFAVVEQGVTVEGFVDVVIEDGGGLEIVDWKTDAVPASAVPARLLEYGLQAGLYVLALEAATGSPVRRVTYVFVDPGVEVSPGEPAELAAEARARLAEFAAAENG